MCIYIYMHRAREREREREILYVCVYMYVYIHQQMNSKRERERDRDTDTEKHGQTIGSQTFSASGSSDSLTSSPTLLSSRLLRFSRFKIWDIPGMASCGSRRGPRSPIGAHGSFTCQHWRSKAADIFSPNDHFKLTTSTERIPVLLMI